MTTTTTTQPAAKERPILFSDRMVRAILDGPNGPKTQTRRVITPQPIILNPNNPCGVSWAKTSRETICTHIDGLHLLCPYGRVGDRLWIREAWAINAICGSDVTVDYRASVSEIMAGAGGRGGRRTISPPTLPTLKRPVHGEIGNTDGVWRPSIHMPRWASRLVLEITKIRVERIQDISDADARAEGVADRAAFQALWDAINDGRGFGWESNPWVWVVEFKRVEVAHG